MTEQAEANLRKDFEAELKKRAQAVEMATEKRFAEESARLEKQIRKEAKQESNANLIEWRKQLAEVEEREKASQADFKHRLSEEKAQLEKQARKDAQAEIAIQVTKLQKQLAEKEKQLTEIEEQRITV